MFKHRLFLALVALAAALAGPRPAGAADASDLPPVDPLGHWHVLTQDDATSDSKCIGNPVTPLCAVETIRACYTRREDHLCQIGEGLDYPPGRIKLKKRPELSERYRVLATKVIADDNGKSLNGQPLMMGDAVIQIMSVLCRADKCERPMGTPTYYLVRPSGDHWVVITWQSSPW